MLQTNAKLWQARVVPPIPIEILSDAATAAAAGAAAAAAAAPATAAAAAMVAAGTGQIVHVVARYLSCFEEQTRGYSSSGDALTPARWLTTAADPSIIPAYIDQGSAATTGSASVQVHTHHTSLNSLVRSSCVLACLCSSNDAQRLYLEGSGDRILLLEPPKGELQRPQDAFEKVFLCYLGTLADGLHVSLVRDYSLFR
jgi:hypothetical protein